MVKIFELMKGIKARLWVDELPETIVGDFASLDTKVNVLGTRIVNNKKIALELSVPRQNNSYGLLGLELVSIHNSEFKSGSTLWKSK